MKVLHTIAGTRLDHGGTSRSVPALCEAISQQGVEVHFLTTRPADPTIPFSVPRPPVQSDLVVDSRRFGRLFVGKRFRRLLSKTQTRLIGTDLHTNEKFLIHDHGIWLAPNHSVAAFARRYKARRVVSPRGMLSAWAIGKGRWKKGLAWWAYQRADLRSAIAFHVTAKQEADEVRALGFTQPIAVIANGISLPDRPSERQRRSGLRRMLFLSRIHPKKGLIQLVRAWKLANVSNDWELVIVGPDEGGYRQQVENEVRELNLASQISFPGSVGDTDKWQMYADADAFILPSFSENFGIVIGEALAAGLPVITTTGTPWQELPQRGCGWWVEPTVAELSMAIATATQLSPATMKEMGLVGANWVRGSFGWDSIATKMIQFYAWLHESSDRPEFVEVLS